MQPEAPRTIRALLAATTPWLQKKGSTSARLDAELLLGHALSLSRIGLYMDLDRPLSDDELEACRALVKRRGAGEPVAYLTGQKGFFGLVLAVTKAVLIPRPETERLVELALARLPTDDDGVVIDVGTGSGCIALALLSARKHLRVVATDTSAAALAVARDNAAALGLSDRLTLREGDLLGPCADVRDVRLVVSNPPYIVPGSPLLERAVAQFEPALALYGEGDDGLGHHRRLVAAAPALLGPDAAVMVEIGADQGTAAVGLATAALPRVSIERDLDGHDRVVVLQR
jgi:release factor glutamine methyltransferase